MLCISIYAPLFENSVFDTIDLNKDPLPVVNVKLQYYRAEILGYQIRAVNEGNKGLLKKLKEHEAIINNVLTNFEKGEYNPVQTTSLS